MSDLWIIPPEQTIKSAQASINSKKVPAVFNLGTFVHGTLNADIGGGRYDTGSEACILMGVTNHIYDPFNRDAEHNRQAIARIRAGQCITATVSNVLNVIKEASVRDRIIRQAANCVNSVGTAFFYIYEGDKSDVGRVSQEKDGVPLVWQENRKTFTYVPEIRKHFRQVDRKGTLLIARGRLLP